MRQHILFIFISATLLFATSCAPMTKERYLAEYKEFIEEVKANSKNYGDGNWASADEQFQIYSEEYYTKFEDEFTMKEKLTLASWSIQYGTLRSTKAIKDMMGFVFDEEDGLLTFLREEYNDDVQALVSDLSDEITYYRENQMEEDLTKLKNALNQAAESIPELEILLEELNHDSLDNDFLDHDNQNQDSLNK